jgi:hypothetical protein
MFCLHYPDKTSFVGTKLRLSGKLHSKIGVGHDSTKLLDAKRTVLVDLDEE